MARIIVSIADLRREPYFLLPKNFDHHVLRDSQLLFNEHVHCLEHTKEWIRVAAVEQLRFLPGRGWRPYEGWVHQSEVAENSISAKFVMASVFGAYPYGTYLDTPLLGARKLGQCFNRQQLIQEALQFLDMPYLWGGRSSCLSGQIASVDCSGLIDLLYRAQGILIPRDAHDQYLFGTTTSTLRPGDPLYLSKGERINHVILKISDEQFIEAPESGRKVRLLKWGVDLWEKEGLLHFYDRPHPYKGFPISLLQMKLKIN